MSSQVQISQVNTLSISEYHELAELECLRVAWSNLVKQVGGLSIFVTPEWLFSWWQAYGAGRQLCVLLITDSQAGVVGILPLYWECRRTLAFRNLRILRLMGDGSGDSDDLDFIVKPGYAAPVLQIFSTWLRSASWDVCEFDCLSPNSEVAALLAEELRVLEWKGPTSRRPCTKVALPSTWEQYLKQLSAKERGKVGNRLRRLQSRHQVEFRRCERIEDLPRFLEALYLLHQKRWEAKGEPGNFTQFERRHFYQEMTQALLGRGWLELWLMEMDGTAVAAQIGMRYGDCLCSLQEGFDPEFASDSVGYVLRSHVLRESIEGGLRTYDFLCGDQEAKQRWGATVTHYVDLHFARPNSFGAAYLAVVEAFGKSKEKLHENVSDATWKKLQRFGKFVRGLRAVAPRIDKKTNSHELGVSKESIVAIDSKRYTH